MTKGEIVKQINEYYWVEKDHRNTLWIVRKDGKKLPLRFRPHNPIYLCYPYKPKNEEEARKLLKEGKCIKVTPWELYVDVFGEDFAYKRFHGYSKRTAKYLENILKNRGFVKIEGGYNEIKGEVVDSWKQLAIPKSIEYQVIKTEDGQFVVQYIAITAIDDYDVVKLYFDRKPSRRDVEIVEMVLDLQIEFMLGNLDEEFVCWECGRKTHWLDIRADNLAQKIEFLREHYCGC